MGNVINFQKQRPESVDEVVEACIASLADSTRETYRKIWTHWAEYLRESHGRSPEQASSVEANCYISDWAKHAGYSLTKGRNCTVSNQTLKQGSMILRRLYSHLIGVGLCSSNPFTILYETFRHRQPGKRMPHIAIKPQTIMDELLPLFPNTRDGRRDRAWFLCMFGCGMRLREVTGLKVGDFRCEEGAYILDLAVTKTGREQEQVIPNFVAEHLKRYFDERRKIDGAKQTDPAFVHFNRAGYPALSYNYMIRHLRKLGQEVGIPRITPHDGRASVVTAALDQGWAPRDIMALTRHRSTAMIDLYDKRRLNYREHPAKHFSLRFKGPRTDEEE